MHRSAAVQRGRVRCPCLRSSLEPLASWTIRGLSRSCYSASTDLVRRDAVVAQLAIECPLADVQNFCRFAPIAARFTKGCLDRGALDLRHRHPGIQRQRRGRRLLIWWLDRNRTAAGAQCRRHLARVSVPPQITMIALFIHSATQFLNLQPELQHAAHEKLQLTTLCANCTANQGSNVP